MCRPKALTSSLTNTDSKNDAPSEFPVPSFHFLVQSITPIRMWLNHYQYVALLRMKDYLARLASDLGRVQSTEAKMPSPPSVCVSVLVEALEFGLLFPPTAAQEEEAPEETDTQSLTDSELSASHRNSGVMDNADKTSEQEDECDAEGEGPVEEACEAVEENDQDREPKADTSTVDPTPPQSPANASTLQNQDSSSLSLEGELSSALTATKDATKDALSASIDLTKGALSITKDAFSILSRGSAMSKIFNSQSKEPDDSTLRLQPLKHSLSQNSCDSVVTENSAADDGLSLDSDTSENFIILTDTETTRPNGTPIHSVRTDGGSSADLTSSLSHSIEELSQDMVCVLLFSVRGVTSLMELHEEDVVVATEVQSVIPKQLGNQRTVDLATLAHGDSSPPVPPQTGPPVMCVRVEGGPRAGRHCCSAESAGFIDMRVQGCEAELLTSTLNAIGPFLEDELNGDAQPIRITVHNTSITLKDDGPRVYPTSPQSVPVAFLLDGVVLERLDDPVLILRPTDSHSGDACQREEDGKICSLQSQLSEVHSALSAALSDRERLLQEIHKYDPSFSL